MKTILLVACCTLINCWGQLRGQEVVNTLKRISLNQCELPKEENYIVLSTVRLITSDTIINNVPIHITDTSIIIPEPYCTNLDIHSNAILEYRTFPFSIKEHFAVLDTVQMSRIDYGGADGYQLDLSNPSVSGALIDSKGLNYNGSFSRGFSVGNSQSLVLNSNFDMQMVGDLGNGLKVVAAISDDNIPIQPQGNTQVLQEFDRIFIEVSKDDHSVIAGDYAIQRPQSYFLNYFKKVKGLGGNTSFNLNEKTKIKTQANVTSSRGKFARQTLEIQEGNQGPYRLQGNNNERFIIVLSGSEKVYYNGELIKRGLENDYVIDYNTADIIFSPNRLVSKETRVIVEFEYTDQNYFRTLYTLESNIEHEKYQLNVNFYSEQDSKNSTSQIDLDSTDLAIIRASGDDRAKSFRSGIRSIDPENLGVGVGYRLVKNPSFPSDPDEFILQFEPNSDSVSVVASFTEVGANQGSYSINQTATANGRVYEYVGSNQGSYAPIVELIPPEQRRTFSVGGHYQIHRNAKVLGEFALSDFDRNRLSAVDDQDNIGLAGMIGYELNFKLTDSASWEVFNHSSYEVLDEHYNVLNPYRNAEFARDWNTELQFQNEEKLVNTSVGIKNGKLISLQYDYSNYTIRNLFEGFRHGALIQSDYKGFKLKSKPTLTYSESENLNKKFYRPNIIASQKFDALYGLSIGINYEGEINLITDSSSEVLTDASYSFDYLKSFIKTDEEHDFQGFVSYNKRIDRFSNGNELKPSIDINEIELGTDWEMTDGVNLNVSLKGRDFNVLEPSLVEGETDKKTILGSLNFNYNGWDGAVSSSTNYQLNSGQEPKLEYVFQEVENVQGNYVYLGSDTDTVQNINDFRFDPSNPLASYIRIAIPNNEFIRTNNLIFNQSLRLDAGKILVKDSIKMPMWKRFLSKFSTNSNVQLLNKSIDETGASIDPFAFNAIDSSLVSYNAVSTHALFFNRQDPKYDISLVHKNNGNRNNQINGFEERRLTQNELRIRWNVINSIDAILTMSRGRRFYDSELFDPRDFNIQFSQIQPELNWRFGTQTRIVLHYKYDQRQQTIRNLESATNHDLTFAFNYREKNNSALDASMSFVNVDYKGEEDSAIEYDILDGLKDGTNFLWRASYTRRLANNIDLSIAYDGRKTGDANAVHVGRVQAKATF